MADVKITIRLGRETGNNSRQWLALCIGPIGVFTACTIGIDNAAQKIGRRINCAVVAVITHGCVSRIEEIKVRFYRSLQSAHEYAQEQS